MVFMKPKDLKQGDKFRWCKKQQQMTCDTLCTHRKLQGSENKEYNKSYADCIRCKGGE